MKKYIGLSMLVLAFVFAAAWLLGRMIGVWVPEAPKKIVTKVKPEPETVKPQRRKYKYATILPPKNQNKKKIEDEPEPKPPKRLPSLEQFLQMQKITPYKNLPQMPKPSSKHYVLKRSVFKDWLKLPLAENGSRFVPSFIGGRPNGMKVTVIHEGSFLHRIGLIKGDVLKRVNGKRIWTPGQAHKVYSMAARRHRNLTMVFVRGDRELIVDFSLR